MSVAKVRCLGCGAIGRWARRGRCPKCETNPERNPMRRQYKADRYDSEHRRLRRQWKPYVDAGGVRCARARLGQCLHASSIIEQGEEWHLDHLPGHRRAPSHADCNTAARRNPARSNK